MTTLVLGGMGVAAGVEFANALTMRGQTVLRSDREYPCRVKYLSGQGESPAPHIANEIEKWADNHPFSRWVMACNTAHSVYAEVSDYLPSNLADRGTHLVNTTRDAVKWLRPVWLGTTVLAHNTDLVRGWADLPSDKEQEIVQAAIWAAKLGQFPYTVQMRAICDGKLVVAGCTEMPAILRVAGITGFINPVDVI